MDFTREPVIQTVITPKEGCKLVVRSSKGLSQEEYFVDAVEVVSFGEAVFYRSLEKPKNFLLPVTDYEILEVREARMVLKHVGMDRSIKIGGGREATLKTPRDHYAEKQPVEPVAEEKQEAAEVTPAANELRPEARSDKKRDRRRHYRRRRSREEKEEGASVEGGAVEEGDGESGKRTELAESGKAISSEAIVTTGMMATLLPPPPTLISETIARYREDALFKEAFYSRKEKEEEAEGQASGEQGVEEVVDQEPHGIASMINEDPAHPTIPPEEHRQDGEAKANGDQWNFSEELSNNNKNS